MKILNVEDDEEILYVQNKDLALLERVAECVPPSIQSRISSGSWMLQLYNPDEFFDFDDPEEIAFFEQLDWILDYRKVSSLSEQDIMAMQQQCLEKVNFIKQQAKPLRLSNRKESHDLWKKIDLEEHKIACLDEILTIRHGLLPEPAPIANERVALATAVGDSIYHQPTKQIKQKVFSKIFLRKS